MASAKPLVDADYSAETYEEAPIMDDHAKSTTSSSVWSVIRYVGYILLSAVVIYHAAKLLLGNERKPMTEILYWSIWLYTAATALSAFWLLIQLCSWVLLKTCCPDLKSCCSDESSRAFELWVAFPIALGGLVGFLYCLFHFKKVQSMAGGSEFWRWTFFFLTYSFVTASIMNYRPTNKQQLT
jgi:hypothetical protein